MLQAPVLVKETFLRKLARLGPQSKLPRERVCVHLPRSVVSGSRSGRCTVPLPAFECAGNSAVECSTCTPPTHQHYYRWFNLLSDRRRAVSFEGADKLPPRGCRDCLGEISSRSSSFSQEVSNAFGVLRRSNHKTAASESCFSIIFQFFFFCSYAFYSRNSTPIVITWASLLVRFPRPHVSFQRRLPPSNPYASFLNSNN